MNQPKAPLDRDLQHLREALATLDTPAPVSAHLRAAFKARARRADGSWLHSTGQWFAPGAALTLSISMSLWLFMTPPAAMVAPTLMQSSGAGNFIALRPLAQIELEPNPRVIETQLPKIMLAAMGMAIAPEVAGESVRAQLLVSAAGQPLAVRFSPLN
jgi:hypothetical protein